MVGRFLSRIIKFPPARCSVCNVVLPAFMPAVFSLCPHSTGLARHSGCKMIRYRNGGGGGTYYVPTRYPLRHHSYQITLRGGDGIEANISLLTIMPMDYWNLYEL